MKSAPIPANEAARLKALHALGILDTLPQPMFDEVTRLAANICNTPIALISLIDHDRQWFKSRVGLSATQTSREIAFCSHAILQPADVLVVEDASKDDRFVDNPLVTGDPAIRFYAGAPILTPEGLPLGTVCVLDQVPRVLSGAQQESLQSLSRLVMHLLHEEQSQQDRRTANSVEARRRLDSMMAIASQGIDIKAFIDTDYVWRYVNDRYLEYWQAKREDIEGKRLSDVVDERVFTELVKPHLDRALNGEATFYEAVFNFPVRGKTHVEVAYSPARDSGGTIIGVVARVHDIQRRKEREAQLQRTFELLELKTVEQERFIHILSHDLREPINSIVNFASLLEEELSGRHVGSSERFLSYVARGGRRLKQLVEELVSFVQLDRKSIEAVEVDMESLLNDIRADLDSALSRTGGRIESSPLSPVVGDRTLLLLAVENLVANALKFGRPGVPPVVVLSSTRSDTGFVIEVTDNGIGIPEAQRENIFEVFKRLHARNEYAGNGLGLSICRKIADMHGGQVVCQSTVGAGSTFSIHLPYNHAVDGVGDM